MNVGLASVKSLSPIFEWLPNTKAWNKFYVIKHFKFKYTDVTVPFNFQELIKGLIDNGSQNKIRTQLREDSEP